MFHLYDWKGSREPILALICDLPEPERSKRFLVMLQAFIDESTEGSSFVLAGYVASPEQWAKFSTEWEEVLGIRPKWQYLHMKDIGFPHDVEKLEKLQALYRVLEKHVAASIACAVDVTALQEIVDRLQFPEILKNPYFLGLRTLYNVVINWQERMGFSEPIDFVLDNNQVEPRVTEIWASFLSNLPEHLQKYVGQKPRFDDDKRVRPLQAADSYAWWVRRWRETDGFIHGEKLPYPWNPKVAFPRLTIEVHRGAIEHEMESLKVRVYALMAAGSDLSQKPR